MGVLAYKCSIDKSGRGTVRFVFDSSKNFGGAAWMHVANLMIAGLLGRVGSSGGDACQWYFIEIMIDTTLGVYVEYMLLQLLLVTLRNWGVGWLADSIEAPCISMPVEQDIEAGAGGSPDTGKAEPLLKKGEKDIASELAVLLAHLDKGKYAMQLFSWLGVVTVMKFIMVMIMLALSPQLEALSGLVLDPLTNPSLRLVVVMILTPGVMNAVQFWLQDNIFVDVAKWHDKKQAAQAEANKADMDSGSFGFSKTIMDYDQDFNKEQRALEASQAAVLEMLEGSPELRQRVKESFDVMLRCQQLQDEKYSTQSAKLKELQYELQRRTDGSFVKDVVRGLAAQSMVVDKYSPIFTVNAAQPLPNEYVAVCGDGELGDWDVAKAVPLKTATSKWPKWESESIPLDRSKHLHQYNFVILNKDTHEVVRWEDGCRRVLYSGSYPATADFDRPPKK